MLRAEHLDRAEAPEAPRAYLDAALAQSAALQPERALALVERGAALASEPDDVVALNMLRGRLRCESGEGRPAVDAYEVALAATRQAADRCRALIGIAAGHRLLTGVDAALAALAEAEPLARADGLARELSELHYIRGNLYFARGDIAACRAEHHAALACARSLSDPMWEARALSGLADADYADGRMRSALARFDQCVELCDRARPDARRHSEPGADRLLPRPPDGVRCRHRRHRGRPRACRPGRRPARRDDVAGIAGRCC